MENLGIFSALEDSLLDLLNELKDHLKPYTKRAYLVGGAPRDLLLKRKVGDLDVEIYDMHPDDFDSFAKKIDAIGVGKSFFVYKWKGFDLSIPRIESKVASGHQGFKVSYCNKEKLASSRRDFTINALMIDIFSGKLLDFWGGLDDIKVRKIRLIDEKKFAEDSLRILRGARFSSQLGFSIDAKTFDVMKSMGLDEISKERIFWELEKIFLSPNLDLGFLNLYKLGIFKKLFGIDFGDEKAKKISYALKEFHTHKTESLHPFIFLYVLLNQLDLDIKKSLKNIKAPNEYINILSKSPYKLLPLLDKELLKISLEIPLKNWVGICQRGLVERAKELGIYEKKFDFHIKVADIIKDGFEGKDIGIELKRRQLEYINSL
ncbi:MAG: hypothetical protein CR967_00365 [Proteobacteria bacterium]|nr:MAG: hypothetical protein CR967_00365 [Pseudomonadota bacterium]